MLCCSLTCVGCNGQFVSETVSGTLLLTPCSAVFVSLCDANVDVGSTVHANDWYPGPHNSIQFISPHMLRILFIERFALSDKRRKYQFFIFFSLFWFIFASSGYWASFNFPTNDCSDPMLVRPMEFSPIWSPSEVKLNEKIFFSFDYTHLAGGNKMSLFPAATVTLATPPQLKNWLWHSNWRATAIRRATGNRWNKNTICANEIFIDADANANANVDCWMALWRWKIKSRGHSVQLNRKWKNRTNERTTKTTCNILSWWMWYDVTWACCTPYQRVLDLLTSTSDTHYTC